jgi:hypothetical protein
LYQPAMSGFIPIIVISKSSVEAACMLKSPVLLVAVPRLVPFNFTDTPDNGAPYHLLFTVIVVKNS